MVTKLFPEPTLHPQGLSRLNEGEEKEDKKASPPILPSARLEEDTRNTHRLENDMDIQK
jgi:hypothetical protein